MIDYIEHPILVGVGDGGGGKTPLVLHALGMNIISCCGVHWLVLSISIFH